MVAASRAPRSWSTPADVVQKLRRRWDTGELLVKFATGEPFVPFDVPVRGPTSGDVATRFGEVQEWVAQWREVDHHTMRVAMKTIGGRVVGVNEIPDRAWIDSYDRLWSLLRRTSEVRRFTELLRFTESTAPRLVEWMLARPLEVLRHQSIWDRLLATTLWIDSNGARDDMYLRQVDVPGVDTKFIESHRKILAALLDRQLPEHRVNGSAPPSDFAGRYGFLKKPAYIRFRWLGQHEGFTELTVRTEELASMPISAATVFVVENEITYLAFPPVPNSIVVAGGGYALSQTESLTWLSDRDVVYWGDIDTHGFVILDRLRQKFAHVRSMLMDRVTLLAHREQWVTEPTPVNARLEMLRPDEAALYLDLVEDTYGAAVRLEQERISYGAIKRETGL